jgi:hypothetical protein
MSAAAGSLPPSAADLGLSPVTAAALANSLADMTLGGFSATASVQDSLVIEAKNRTTEFTVYKSRVEFKQYVREKFKGPLTQISGKEVVQLRRRARERDSDPTGPCPLKGKTVFSLKCLACEGFVLNANQCMKETSDSVGCWGIMTRGGNASQLPHSPGCKQADTVFATEKE